MLKLWVVTLATLTTLAGCRSRSGSKPEGDEAPKPVAAKVKDAAPEKVGTSGRHRAKEGSDWKPAEFKRGRAKWKETGVYVDGVPVAMLTYGEMPLGMTPFWTGDDEPGDEATQRFRFHELLQKVGVDVTKIKEMHVYGGGLHTAVISGDDARKHSDKLGFRFGTGIQGKTIISFPPKLKVNTTFDKMTALTVYVDKKPPAIDSRRERPIKDGKIIWTIPYFGDPIRGGVRIYKDNRLALHLKRNKLEESEDTSEWTKDKKEQRFKLSAFLSKYGVDLSDVVVAQVIRHDKRQEILTKEQLDGAYFTALPQSSGMILMNGKLEVKALALHTKPLAKPPTTTGKK